jgi:glycine hydroxymethyltransferase
LQPEFQTYAKQIITNASRLADELMKRGFKLVTNGTDNHLIQVDMMKSYGIDGRVAQDMYDEIGLTANCNAIPDDPLPPFRPSGLRIGTPAITTRGLKEDDMATIAEWMLKVAKSPTDSKLIKSLKAEVKELAEKFPLPSDK